MLQKNAVEPNTLELLRQICTFDSMNDFALGGGTNLALRIGHRLSIYLDFFSYKEFNNAIVFQTITREFPTAELLFGRNQTMMFNINGIKVDFILYPFEWLQAFEFTERSRLISIEDIIPMKRQALSNRFSKKDFWDIAFLLDAFPLAKMIGIFRMKFSQVDPGFIIHSFTTFDEAEREQDPVISLPKTWIEIKEQLEKSVIDYTNEFL